MAEKKTIAVVGATGAQGGGLVRAIAGDKSGRFQARAITRKPESEKGKALAASGVEVVAADLDDVASLERAFAGAYGAFCVTNFWEHFSPEKELAQAGNMARAAKAAGVEHVIWSTLEDTRKAMPLSDDRMPTLMGKYKVPHFDAKGEADQIFRDLGVPTTFLAHVLLLGQLDLLRPRAPSGGRTASSRSRFPMDDKKLPGIAAEDIGKYRVRDLQARARSSSARRWASREGTCRAPRWHPRSRGPSVRRSGTTP